MTCYLYGRGKTAIHRKLNELNNDKMLFNTTNSMSNDHGENATAKNNEQTKLGDIEHFKPNNYGPYGVWVKKIQSDNNELNAYKVGSIVFKKYKHIVDMKKKGKFRAEIMFSNRSEANKMLVDNDLKNHNLEAFIPGFRKIRKGIINGIRIELSEADILQSCESEVEIHIVKRLNRRNRNASTDNGDKWIASESILISFIGQTLPKEVSIFHVKINVEAFVSKPMQYFSCFQYGHLSKSCRGKQKCIICGDEKHDEKCEKPTPTCINCKGGHKSIDTSCLIYKKYTKINILMTYDNISFNDAKLQVMGSFKPPKRSKEHFPELKQPKITRYLNNMPIGRNGNPPRSYSEVLNLNKKESEEENQVPDENILVGVNSPHINNQYNKNYELNKTTNKAHSSSLQSQLHRSSLQSQSPGFSLQSQPVNISTIGKTTTKTLETTQGAITL